MAGKKTKKKKLAKKIKKPAKPDTALAPVLPKRQKRPAKKPPPKRKVRLESARSKTMIELPDEMTELRPGQGSSKRGVRAYVRALAGLVFATDQTRPTTDQLHKRSPFNEVPLATFRQWSVADKWTERRREHQDSVLEGVRKRIGNDLIQAQITMLQDTTGIYSKTLEMLLGTTGKDPPPAKSYESLLRAFVQLISTLSDVRRDVIDVVVPPPTVGREEKEEIPRVMPELTNDEARVAALAIVEARRRGQGTGSEGDG